MLKNSIKIMITLLLFTIPMVVFAKDKLYDFKGQLHQLDEYTGKGKWTVVMIWAHDCHNCNDEAHQYVAFHKKHKDSDAQVIGISLDGKQKQKKAEDFVNRHNLNFDNLIGEPIEVAGIYEDLTGVEFFGTPTFLIYNPAGELRAQQAGAVPTKIIEQFIAKETTK